METIKHKSGMNIGRKIERIRKMRGFTQTELGEKLGVTKQSISKMEQSEKIDDEKITKIAEALGVTPEGIKGFNEEAVVYNTINFYENCNATHNYVCSTIYNSVDDMIKIYEKVFEEREKKIEKRHEKLSKNL
ncbi:helix-turn-helix domain-containing protein [Sinomicrobium oceani]|uniref:helix-turn-helix domain-containing protein n=1 Tax=Sinomicrobium oceani TaxID=1150368 RepID=UPI00227CF6D1|nr:helix-turn-helix transcriptional regulator [Sinomicrobium oceani]